MFDLTQLEVMNEHEERGFWACWLRVLRRDDGEAAQSHLREGRPVYYCDEALPKGIIREWPSGLKEVVHINDDGSLIVRG